jgi:tRNA threonylcarbamoyladenosine biosynthesis protein TsaB
LKLIAFDTATEACSAALYNDGITISRFNIAPRQHARLILPMIDQLLSEAEYKLSDLDAIAFGRGPGAFTGVRIAAGVAQGLAFANDLPVIPVSSLATLAQSVNDKADYIAAAIDARMGEVYFGLYKGSDNVIQLIGNEYVISPGNIKINNITRCYGIGTGWLKYETILAEIFTGKLSGHKGQTYPHAKDMIVIALSEFSKGNLCNPEDAIPVYLRDKVTG